MCAEAAGEAMVKYRRSEVIHTDLGRQFVGRKFTEFLRKLVLR